MKSKRDLRVDFFKGFSLIMIFMAHVPWFLLNFIWSRWGFSSAFELFVFLSGYVSVSVYGKALTSKGIAACIKKVYLRIRDIWIGHMILGISDVLIVYAVSRFSFSTFNQLVEFFQFDAFFENPMRASLEYAALLYQPSYMDILPLYIVLLLPLPWLLPILQKSPWKILGGSALVWLIVQINPKLSLFQFMAFEPLGWQLFFVAGMVAQQKVRDQFNLRIPSWGLMIAWMIVMIGFFSQFAFALHKRELIDEDSFFWLAQMAAYSYDHKREASFIRIAHFAALFALVKYYILDREISWRRPIFRPFINLGQNSLQIYVLSSILAVLLTVKIFTIGKHHAVEVFFFLICVIILFTYASFLSRGKRAKHFVDKK